MMTKINEGIAIMVLNLMHSHFLSWQMAMDLEKYLIIFGVHNIALIHVDNRKRNVLIHGKSPTEMY